MAQSKVPKFGAWEGGENYTVFFDNARKKKSNGQMINPNDPQDNPELFPQNGGPAQAPRSEPKEQQSRAPEFGAWNDGENVAYTEYFENKRKPKNGESPASANEPQMNALDPFEPQLNGDFNNRPRPPTAVGSKNRVDDHQLRNASSSRSDFSVATSETPQRYVKQNPGGQSPNHQKGGRLQQRPPSSQGSQTPDRGTAIPAWGVWNTDPKQAEGFTGAFTRAKEEKNTVLHSNIPPRYPQQPQQEEKKGCCFGWF